MNWVAVEDRLPPKNTNVLVWVNSEPVVARYEGGKWYPQDDDGYIYEQVRCARGCCYETEKKTLFYAPDYWCEVEEPITE